MYFRSKSKERVLNIFPLETEVVVRVLKARRPRKRGNCGRWCCLDELWFSRTGNGLSETKHRKKKQRWNRKRAWQEKKREKAFEIEFGRLIWDIPLPVEFQDSFEFSAVNYLFSARKHVPESMFRLNFNNNKNILKQNSLTHDKQEDKCIGSSRMTTTWARAGRKHQRANELTWLVQV